ncbi:hypothetical protein C4D60_Mb01t12160 [Musa balbisiana]|uniref:Uncharacterized protein n=1 Tax=Musa balbisiana TaxID=52838 RepID=A0A4S8JLP0_MUSBA|nr:hypothetical protein C4D60_Mb01t12160 [Musa balbisiana]
MSSSSSVALLESSADEVDEAGDTAVAAAALCRFVLLPLTMAVVVAVANRPLLSLLSLLTL